ncbi:unnamed protein product [Ilex paraguariensis]|uniref:Tobamovirus multiplication protein 2A n=1 Tax=Ilex paraguariensis TaxID=185542 RepID=A0ABC8RXU1_9AQUA
MACRGFLECLLKLLNFLLTLVGLAMVGYGIYLFVEYKSASSDDTTPAPSSEGFVQLGRPILMVLSLSSSSIFDNLPKACFFSASSSLVMIGFLKAMQYSVLVILLILVELGCAAFIFFDKSWKDDIPTDKTGDFDMLYEFLDDNWEIVRWVALGAVILEALVFLLALLVRAANRPAEYDSDDEYIAGPRQQIQQPLINSRSAVPAASVPVAGTLDNRPGRNDAWSTRMREKYGLDTSKFTYNQQTATQPAEERSRCTIM